MSTALERRQSAARSARYRMRQAGSQWARPQSPTAQPFGAVPVGNVRALTDIKGPSHGLKIAYIPDAQCMPNVDMRHLKWCGQYLAAKRPDVIVCGGDFGDFPSLSKFERGTMLFEGRRYKKDLAAFHEGMELLMEPIKAVPSAQWDPYMEFVEGNHEDHINRAQNEDAKLEGLLSLDDLKLREYGWRQHKFLQPVSIAGVAFCHYFPSGVMGKPITTARSLLTKLHMSAIAGHQQGRDIAFSRRADGGQMTSIITGSFYQHEYQYLSPFTNAHWRGMLMLHEVKDGTFDEMFVSINFLKRKFG